MPWSSQNGGGNDYKKRCGQSSGGNSIPPDVDKILRKGQDHLKQFSTGKFIFFICIIMLFFWMFQCCYIVQQNEQAVDLFFGKPNDRFITEGLHFRLWPIETYRKVSRTEQAVTVGTHERDALMLSGDQNIVNINFSVYYYVSDPTSYLFNLNDQRGTIQKVAESAMREVVGRRPADDVYRDQREAVALEVMLIIQSTLNKYGLGIEVTRVSITEAAPPREVAEAFNSVQQAEQERNRAIEEGNQERAQKRGLANGQASHIREAAAAYKARVIEEARGEAQRFSSVEHEEKIAPDITRFRLYLEAMEGMFSSSGKLILDKSASGVLPYLPLNEMIKPTVPSVTKGS